MERLRPDQYKRNLAGGAGDEKQVCIAEEIAP